MFIIKSELKDAYILKPDKKEDCRGFFTRILCKNQFHSLGLECNFVQSNVSFNKIKGTIRGMHSQGAPYEEVKIVRCSKGAIFDVIVDIRQGSPTFGKWTSIELSEHNHYSLYIPKGFLHGFQSLTDESEVIYLVSEFYNPKAEKSARWNDPFFNIKWPLEVTCISDKDASWPDFSTHNHKTKEEQIN